MVRPVGVGEAPQRFVAIHHHVAKELKRWLSSNEHKKVAIKIYNLIKALLENDADAISGIYRQLAVDHIHECSGLVELGPKQNKGGAARVFVLRDFSAAFFVVAVVEKGTSGVKIDQAKNRADEIRTIFTSNSRVAAMEQLKTLKYHITTIRSEG